METGQMLITVGIGLMISSGILMIIEIIIGKVNAKKIKSQLEKEYGKLD